MSIAILSTALLIAQIAMGIACCLAVYRMIRGPRAQDRVLALDTFYVTSMLLLIGFGIETGTAFYFEAALIIGLLGFVSTVALAKFLLRGEVIE